MKTLVLNLDYSPLSIISTKRAVILTMNNPRIVPIEYHEGTFQSENDIFELPSVVLYDKFVKVSPRKVFSKKHIIQRDKWTCQYCSCKLSSENATVDHVVPSSFFKKREESNTWTNVVACCQKCNCKKKNRTPEDAGMKLIRKPKRPRNFIVVEEGPKSWRKFIDKI